MKDMRNGERINNQEKLQREWLEAREQVKQLTIEATYWANANSFIMKTLPTQPHDMCRWHYNGKSYEANTQLGLAVIVKDRALAEYSET